MPGAPSGVRSLLVVRPGAPSSFLFLVVRPGARSVLVEENRIDVPSMLLWSLSWQRVSSAGCLHWCYILCLVPFVYNVVFKTQTTPSYGRLTEVNFEFGFVTPMTAR